MLSRLFIVALWSPALVGDVYCIVVTFPCCILGQVWFLIVSFPDLCVFLSLLVIICSKSIIVFLHFKLSCMNSPSRYLLSQMIGCIQDVLKLHDSFNSVLYV